MVEFCGEKWRVEKNGQVKMDSIVGRTSVRFRWVEQFKVMYSTVESCWELKRQVWFRQEENSIVKI